MPDPSSMPSADAARELLDRAAGRGVLVVGDAMLDHYVSGSVARISPEAPVPVVHVTEDRTALGGAANVAAGVVALGVPCRLVAAAGDDESGEILRDALEGLGVPAGDLVTTPGRPTTRKTRILGGRQQMLRVDREARTPLPDLVSEALGRAAEAALDETDVLVVQDYDKGAITPSLAGRLLRGAAAREIPSIVDPKLRHFFAFGGATLFKPNRRELAAGLGVEDQAVDELELESMLERLGVHNLLLTLGREGMLLLGRDVDGPQRIPSRAREVFDVTGAGDTVLAVMAAALAAGATLVDAARLATVAAGIEVSRSGAVPVTAEELVAELRQPA